MTTEPQALSIEAFKERLHQQIPLTQHMGFERLVYDGQSLAIHAALAPNVNDKGTGFAGALSATATLCGWSLITLSLEDEPRDYDVVIRDSRLEYLRPVTADFAAVARLPDGATLEAFRQRLREKGKARLDLDVEIRDRGEVALRLQGAYVALERRAWV